MKQKNPFGRTPATFLVVCVCCETIAGRQPVSQSVTGERRSQSRDTTARCDTLEKKPTYKEEKKEKETIAIPPGRATQLHGEVSRVVVFYCGDDRLHELEENQKVPESWLKETQ